jgi:hypothetical protein
MAKVTTEIKELRAFLKGKETLIKNQEKALGNLHKTVLEDIKKIAKLESTKQHYISVIAYLEYKLGQKNGE